jgi:16S rRNA (cytosine967-C5)-methyltransferase
MELETLLKHCSSLTKIVFKSSKSTDEIVSGFFKQKKYIGSKERKIISEILFIHLRFFGFSNYLAQKFFPNRTQSEDEMLTILLSLFINLNLYPEQLRTLFQSIAALYQIETAETKLLNIVSNFIENLSVQKANTIENLHNAINRINDTIRYWNPRITEFKSNSQQTYYKDLLDVLRTASIRYSIPEFIMHYWFDYYNQKQINVFELAESLLFPAQVNIRLNNLQLTREEILDKLRNNGISCEPSLYSPLGIILNERVNLQQHELYRKGLLEIQDEGSQLVCFAVNARPKDRILDACAGAGGKSLLLALLQEDKGEIIANDINYLKLKELQRRAKRSHFQSIKVSHQQLKKKSERLLQPFDIVLVDAPCSGIGTARRMPMQKWRLTPEKLKRYTQKQIELLLYYSQFLRKGGSLVYSTCSLMLQENEEVINAFLEQKRNFEPEPLLPAFNKFGIKLETLGTKDFFVTLLPSLHKTDGFFIAKLKKAT